MLTSYTPEMGDKRPESTQIDAQLAHGGNHWFLKTPLTLKGRGIKHLGVLTADNLVPSAHHKIGWNRYKVTEAAFQAICSTYSVSTENYL